MAKRTSTVGIQMSEDEKFKRQNIRLFIIEIVGAPVLGLAFLWEMTDPSLSLIDRIYAFFNTPNLSLVILISFLGGLIAFANSYNKYLREKSSRHGREYGSSKLMTISDMPKFRKDFFFDPKVVSKCKGFEKIGKKTHFDDEQLKKTIVNTIKLEKQIKKTPLLPITKEAWQTKEDNPYYQCFKNSQIMAQDIYLSTNCKFINRNLNTITIGGSGQGKSFSELFPNAMQANGNYIFTDPSGEILQKTGKFLESMGYAIKVFNVEDFNLSMRYNPLMYLETEKDYNELVDALCKNIDPSAGQSKGANQFFEDAKNSLVGAMLAALKELYPNEPKKQTLTNMMQLLRMAEQKIDPLTKQRYCQLDIVFEELKAKNPRSYAVKLYENFKVGSENVTGSVIISATAVFGRYFDNDDIAKLVEADDLNLYDFATGIDENGNPIKCALFLIIPQNTSSYNFLAAMIYTQLFGIVTKGGKTWRDQHNLENPSVPVHLNFWLDEFANIGSIPNFVELLSVVRKYNISINIIIQALSQLKKMYKDEWETILGNCDTMIYLGGQEPSTVKQMSEKLGQETIKSHSFSIQNKGGGQSYQSLGHKLLSETEIEQIARAYELVFITGCKPFKARKYNLTEHPNYKYFGEADPKNNLNINRFRNTLDESLNNENQYKSYFVWEDTGDLETIKVLSDGILEEKVTGVKVKRLVEIKEKLKTNHERIVEIDNNTISLNDILNHIELLEDKVYNIEHKIEQNRLIYKKADEKRKMDERVLKVIMGSILSSDNKYSEADLKEATENLINSTIRAAKQHTSYLTFYIKSLEKKISQEDDEAIIDSLNNELLDAFKLKEDQDSLLVKPREALEKELLQKAKSQAAVSINDFPEITYVTEPKPKKEKSVNKNKYNLSAEEGLSHLGEGINLNTMGNSDFSAFMLNDYRKSE